MKTIILNSPHNIELTDTDIDTQLEADQALVKVHVIGVCGTDIHAYSGNQPFFSYPRILGHELGVEVVSTGADVKNIRVGDKCSVEPYFNKGMDQAVRRGLSNCGENISVFGVHEDGGMREYFKIQAKYLHKSDKLTYQHLALIEPLAIGCHAVNRANIEEHDKVLIIGTGPIGLATIQFAKLKSASVVAMDINSNRLDTCEKIFNIKTVLNTNSEAKLIDDIKQSLDGDMPTIILDATGNPASMNNTLEIIAHGGKIIFIGLYQGDFTFFDPLFHKKELTLMASRNALHSDFEQIIDLMEKGKIEIDKWITHRISFDDFPKKFEEIIKPESKVIKAIIEL